MGIFDNTTAEERAIHALKFVKVAVKDREHPVSGYLTDVSVAMILNELKRRGVALSTGEHDRG